MNLQDGTIIISRSHNEIKKQKCRKRFISKHNHADIVPNYILYAKHFLDINYKVLSLILQDGTIIILQSHNEIKKQ